MEITDIQNKVWQIDCIGCAIATANMIPPGGIIAENSTCYIHQDPEVPLPGFLVIGTKKHISSIADMTEPECTDFTSLLYDSRKRLMQLSGIESITLIQEERSSHFHCWLFPWQTWMTDKYGNNSLAHIRPIMAHAKTHLKTSEQIQNILDIVEQLKKA